MNRTDALGLTEGATADQVRGAYEAKMAETAERIETACADALHPTDPN